MTLFGADKQHREPMSVKKIHKLYKPLNLFGFGQKTAGLTARKQRRNSEKTATHQPQISDKKVTNSGREARLIRK
jgi:hypothetical protein